MTAKDPKYPVKLPVTFAGLYGAILVASMINLMLYGIGLFMTLQYFKSHAKKDAAWVKATIGVLIILATLETIFSNYQIYDTFITKLGKFALLDTITFSVPGQYMCVYLTAFITQIFFASRIWTISKSLGTRHYLLVLLVIAFALIQISSGLAQVIVMGICKFFSKLSQRTGLLLEATAVQGTAAALSDIVISAALCSIYNAHHTGVKKPDLVINKLIIYAINRALATSFCAVMSVILYYFCSGTYYFLIPFLANTHLYIISVISILTSRQSLREQAELGISMGGTTIGGGVSEFENDPDCKAGSEPSVNV